MTEEEAKTKVCAVAGCDRPRSEKAGRGMCNAHYHRFRAGKSLEGVIQQRGAGWISSHGYRYIGSKGEHRLIMERILGRELHYNEVVHHRDGNPLNNDPSNLELMDRGDHIREHTLGKTNEQRALEKAIHGYCLAGRPA